MTQSHSSHDENQDRHSGKEHAVEERPDDLGAVIAKGAAEIGGPTRDPRRYESEDHAADCRESMECIRNDGYAAAIKADTEFNQEIDACQPG